MSGEREARALGAGDTIQVDGVQYTLRPVVAQHLMDLEREALKSYKRSVLRTYADNMDLLGNNSQSLIEKKFEEVSAWDISSLPQKLAHDVSQVTVNDKLKDWIFDTYGEKPETDSGVHALLAHALDTEKLTPKDVQKLTGGKRPVRGSVRFDQWWVTGTAEGMVQFITTSVRQDHPDIGDSIKTWPFLKLAEAARIVERITSALMGNG